jgi:hypothetical protein
MDAVVLSLSESSKHVNSLVVMVKLSIIDCLSVWEIMQVGMIGLRVMIVEYPKCK